MILQTGGFASGAISTRSRLYCSAICNARSDVVISCPPSGLITRTCAALTSSLILVLSAGSGLPNDLLAIFILLCFVNLQVMIFFQSHFQQLKENQKI